MGACPACGGDVDLPREFFDGELFDCQCGATLRVVVCDEECDWHLENCKDDAP